MTAEERQILETLEAAIRPQHVCALIDSKARLAEQKLMSDPEAVLAWEPLPLDWFGETVPNIIRSSWVFILRAGTTTGAERHPNSHQRMMSYRGAGDMQVRATDQWRSNFLVSDSHAPLEQKWVSIPPNVWHQVVVPPANGHWLVVSFHTAAEKELIEERPDAHDWELTRQRLYEGP